MFENFNPKKTEKIILEFLRLELKKAGLKKLIIPLSGGLDSSTVTFLAVKALGKENVFIARLPYQGLNTDHDADLVISQLKIPKDNVFKIEISKIVNFMAASLGSPDRLRRANLMARVRMIILYDMAKKLKALVCGTENKSEYLLGYFTLFGDSASDLEPIRNLYKTEVISLAKFLKVPAKIINKPPSANLWKGQTDEAELGFSYKQADPILYLHFEKNYSWRKIEKLRFRASLIEKVKAWVKTNGFKHRVPKVCPTCNWLAARSILK